jgi:F0F1-type ATP synthase assembly protein I
MVRRATDSPTWAKAHHSGAVDSTGLSTRRVEQAMSNTSRFLAIGLVLGGLVGVVAGTVMDNIPMGIVFGGGFGLIAGLAIGAALDRRTES